MFPSVLPIPSAQALIDYLRGKPVTLHDAAFAAYEVVGYALGQALGQPAVSGSASAPGAPTSDAHCADCLEAHVARRGPDAGAIPWTLLLPVLLQIIQRFISK